MNSREARRGWRRTPARALVQATIFALRPFGLGVLLVGAGLPLGSASAEPLAAENGELERRIYESACVASNAWEIVDRQKGVFWAPPILLPTRKVPDGPPLGNGDLGVAMGGVVERIEALPGAASR